MTKDIQALHSGISRRDWHAVEVAANAIRDDRTATYLLNALKACRLELDYCADQLAHHGRVGGENGSVATALRDAAAAIAKAEGRP